MELKQKPQITKRFSLEPLSLAIILILGFFLRFSGLGYTHFYGDETKTLYLDKTVSALNFLLDQRKGPVQFIVAWVMEKLTGGFSEFYIRLPFAFAGFLSIIAFYTVTKKIFGTRASLLSTFLFSVNGFYIAFSRIAQYQSFLILFGLLAILFFIKALESKRKVLYIVASLFFTLALDSHYDAVFFLVPIVSMFLLQEQKDFKKLLIFFVLPSAFLLSIFYIPYVAKGYFFSNTINYVARRASGSEYGSNNSLYTFFVYNPVFLHFLYLGISVLYALVFRDRDKVQKLFAYWFLSAFFFFEVAISNPGTHIHNYFLPLIMLSGPGLLWIFGKLRTKLARIVFGIFLVCSGIVLSFFALVSFVPKINTGYPWKDSYFLSFNIKPINKSNSQLYLYGFPYYRGWDRIRDYMYGEEGVRGFYTNDSSVMAKYYLRKYDFTAPGNNFLPQYYIDVEDNMKFVNTEKAFLENYVLEKEFFIDGSLSATVYKLKQ